MAQGHPEALALSDRVPRYSRVPAQNATRGVDDLARRTLVLDDGLTVQNPDPIRYPAPALDTGNTVRMGDIATNLVGNIRYSRGSGGSGDENYRLEPVEEPILTPCRRSESTVSSSTGIRSACRVMVSTIIGSVSA